MSDTNLLQAILDKVNSVDKKVDEVKGELKDTRENLAERIDKIGLQLAELSDDAPTLEEFESVEKRVAKLKSQVKN